MIVDALGRGEQIIILRKGGISEGRGGFKVEHPRFLLFPTLFHQQRDGVVPAAQNRFDELARNFPPPDRLRLEFFAELASAERLDSPSQAEALRGQHIWRDDVIAGRFDWGREQAIFALAVKVFRLPRAIELPLSPAHGGCKSWVELENEIATDEAKPVLAPAEFENKLDRLRVALNGASAPVPLSGSP